MEKKDKGSTFFGGRWERYAGGQIDKPRQYDINSPYPQNILDPAPTEHKPLTGWQKFTILAWIAIVLAVLIVGACDAPPEEDPMNLLTRKAMMGQLGQSATRVPPAATAAKGSAGQGPPQPIVKFAGVERDPQVVTASVFVFDPSNGVTDYGPMVGIALWGSGNSDMHIAEFDIPGSRFTQGSLDQFGQVEQGGGAIISVPCSSLEMRVRNDGNFIPPVGTLAIGSSNINGFGSGAIGVGNQTSELFRTIWMVNAAAGGGAGLGVGASTRANVPPYARTVRIMRLTDVAGAIQANAMRVFRVNKTTGTYDVFTVAANALCPEVPISGNDVQIGIINDDGAQQIDKAAAIFGIGI